MNILVTGAGGFIGRHLVNTILAAGNNVIELNRSHGNVHEPDVFKEFKHTEVDHVFHLAASGTINESWSHIPDYIQSIVVGTSRVLEFCVSKKASCTYISSYMYGMPQYLPIDEKHPIDSANPYALAKRLSEDVCRFYAKEFGVKGSILRPFVIFGPGQNDDFLIPTLIRQVLEETEITVNDTSPKKRDYLFITDFCKALLATIQSDRQMDAYNIGMGVSYTIPELIGMIQGIAGTNKSIVSRNIVRKNDYPDVVASIQKAKSELNWSPEVSMETAFRLCMGRENG